MKTISIYKFSLDSSASKRQMSAKASSLGIRPGAALRSFYLEVVGGKQVLMRFDHPIRDGLDILGWVYLSPEAEYEVTILND